MRKQAIAALGSAIVVPVIVVVSTSGAVPTNQTPRRLSPAAATYLAAALDVIEHNALEVKADEWQAIRTEAVRFAGNAKTPLETYSAITHALRRLGSKHSQFSPPASATLMRSQPLDPSDIPLAKLLAAGIGYVSVPHMGIAGSEEDTVTRYVHEARSRIGSVDALGDGTRAWVVDLRLNSGGNTWAMLAGLASLMPDGPAGGYTLDIPFRFQNGELLCECLKGKTGFGSPCSLRNGLPDVAVLIGFRTGSAGEAVAVAFRGHPKVRLFGGPTSGFATGVRCYPMSDGAQLCLANSRLADRTGQVYGDQIQPDETVNYVHAPRYDGERDDAVDAALAWLKQRRQ